MKARYVTNTYQITDKYANLLLNAKNAKVKIEPSNDDSTTLVVVEKKRNPYTFFIQDNKLTIQLAKTSWCHFLKIGIDHSEIKLRVPQSTLEEIWIMSNIGYIDIASIVCNGVMNIQTNTGKVNVENVSCKNFYLKGNTGAILLSNLVSKENVSIRCNTGKVQLNNCIAPEIFVKTNTGNVCGRLPSNVVFTVRVNTGKIDVPNVPIGEAVGGRCEIKTNTGSIKFE